MEHRDFVYFVPLIGEYEQPPCKVLLTISRSFFHFGIESLDGSLESEMRARIIGYTGTDERSVFLFVVFIGVTVMRHTDQLSKTLQQKTLSAAAGQQVAACCLSVLKSLHSDNQFEVLYKQISLEQK